MTTRVGTESYLSIGDFSRLTHMSVKTLRHYHRIGLLQPAKVDPDNGYRSYTTAQIPTAQMIRRYRELQMPLKQIRDLLEATDPETRNALISSHLHALQSSLAETQSVVAALHECLGSAPRDNSRPTRMRVSPSVRRRPAKKREQGAPAQLTSREAA